MATYTIGVDFGMSFDPPHIKGSACITLVIADLASKVIQ